MRSTIRAALARRRLLRRRLTVAAGLLPASLVLDACVGASARPVPVERLQATYSTPLVEVARPSSSSGAGAREGGGVTTRIGDSLRYVYADGLLEIRTAMQTDRIALAVTNRGDDALTVLWNDARYADHDGVLSTMTRAAARRVGRGRPQPSSVIAARRTLTGALLPSTRVGRRPGSEGPFGWRRGGWEHAPLIAAATATLSAPRGSAAAAEQRAAFVASVRAMMGKRVGVVIPVRSRGVVTAYTLWFTVDGAAVVEAVE